MALVNAAAASTTPVATVYKKKQGASGAPSIYAVPSGRYFVGRVYMSQNSTPSPKINGVEINVDNMNCGSSNDSPLEEFVLVAGTVVSVNTNTSYYTYVSGAEYAA